MRACLWAASTIKRDRFMPRAAARAPISRNAPRGAERLISPLRVSGLFTLISHSLQRPACSPHCASAGKTGAPDQRMPRPFAVFELFMAAFAARQTHPDTSKTLLECWLSGSKLILGVGQAIAAGFCRRRKVRAPQGEAPDSIWTA